MIIRKFLSFLHAVSLGFTLNVIGKLFIVKLLDLLNFLLLKFKKLLKKVPGFNFTLKCFILLLGVQTIIDIVNNSDLGVEWVIIATIICALPNFCCFLCYILNYSIRKHV